MILDLEFMGIERIATTLLLRFEKKYLNGLRIN